MAAPTVTPLPTAPARNVADPETYIGIADTWASALPTFGAEVQAAGEYANTKALASAASAAAALASQGIANTKAGEASDSAAAALESEEAAAGAAFTATSTTSNSIGGGSKTWAVGTGRSYQAGLFVVVSDAADSSNYCHGQVTAYSGGNLTVDVTTSGGSGTYTSWNIGLSGPEGPAASLPAGLISMWSGTIASIPAGWALCDGSNGTPDLRSKFLVGASATGGYAVGDTGGQTSVTPTITVDNHTLTTAQMPSHAHNVAQASNVGAGSAGYTDAGGQAYPTGYTGGGGSHNHTASSSAVSTLPPYYALAFIMKL